MNRDEPTRGGQARVPCLVVRLPKMKGRSPRMRLESVAMTSSEAPTMGARSILLITSKSERVMPAPPLRGIFSAAQGLRIGSRISCPMQMSLMTTATLYGVRGGNLVKSYLHASMD